MLKRLRIEYLRSEVEEVEKLIGAIPQTDKITRKSFEKRLVEARQQLAAVEKEPEGAATTVFFSGDPVIGSYGIEADFAGEALRDYQQVVSRVYSSRVHGQMRQSGPVPAAHEAQLFVTRLPQGSFGFQLEHIPKELPLADSEMSKVLEETTKLVAIAANGGDEEFGEAIIDVDQRIVKSLNDFFNTLNNHGATLRVVTGELSETLGKTSIQIGRGRTEGLDRSEEPSQVDGILLGIAPLQRRFDFQSIEPISGKTHPDIQPETLAEWNKLFLQKRCTANLDVVILRRLGKTFKRYILRSIEPLSS